MMNRELPPTNGLSIQFSDLFIRSNAVDLATRLSHLLNIPKPALTCSGTVAFIVALQTLKARQPQRHQVIIPAWTCPLVALAIEKIGLIPVICDLEENRLNFDIYHLQQLTNDQTLAIVVTHFAGLVSDFSLVQEIARHYQTSIIEDAAQSMGASIQQQSVGLIGDIAFFSLAFGKGLTSGEGGVLFSKHAELHKKLHENVQQLPILRKWEIQRCIELFGYSLLYRPATLAWIYGNPLRKALKNHDEILAVGDDFDLNSIPIHQLGMWRNRVASNASTRLNQHWENARLRAQSRIAHLKLLPHLHIFETPIETQATYPFFICLVDHADLCKKIMDQLWTMGVGVTKLFVRSISQYPVLAHIQAQTPHATDFAQRSFTISNSEFVTDVDFQIIFNVLQKTLVDEFHSILS